MEQPVVGFLLDTDGVSSSDSEHTHEVYLITWDGQHVHPFSGITSFDVGHRHSYAGITQPAPSGVPHMHSYYTVTTFDDGHRHEIRGVTGPAIPLPTGGHYHMFTGEICICKHDTKKSGAKERGKYPILMDTRLITHLQDDMNSKRYIR